MFNNKLLLLLLLKLLILLLLLLFTLFTNLQILNAIQFQINITNSIQNSFDNEIHLMN